MLQTLAACIGQNLYILATFVILRNWSVVLYTARSHNILLFFWLLLGTNVIFWLIRTVISLRTAPHEIRKRKESEPAPLFFPSRTSHTRLFPKAHSFSYSYLLAGIPVGWEGSAGGMLAADRPNKNIRAKAGADLRGGIYSVDAGDYLERGNGRIGLQGKLRQYLESQNIDYKEYPYAYLITAPKFLGYSFNPVSFWYLYSIERDLVAMVLEVNNTFDERHMYFLRLRPGSNDRSDPDREVPINQSAKKDPLPGVMTNQSKKTSSMPKEFHVSPFNSRKGSYSVVAYDPLYPSMSGRGAINNTIVLKSSNGHTKLVARIFSEGSFIDPTTMSLLNKVQFLASWWWVGFVTYPRIVREAGKLFFWRKLHVWFRPEPRKDSIGRNADNTEQALEQTFRAYLKYLVECSASALAVNYLPSGVESTSNETFVSASGQINRENVETLDFKVLTPVFYTRFAHYTHDIEAIFCELQESCTIWLSRPDLLSKLVFETPTPPQIPSSWMSYAGFRAIQTLRKRPAPIVGPLTSKKIDPVRLTKTSDIRKFRVSSLDGFVLSNFDTKEQAKYQAIMLKLFISDRIALGSVSLLDTETFLLRSWILWVVARYLQLPGSR